jgi:hypothetical protein
MSQIRVFISLVNNVLNTFASSYCRHFEREEIDFYYCHVVDLKANVCFCYLDWPFKPVHILVFSIGYLYQEYVCYVPIRCLVYSLCRAACRYNFPG